MATENIAVLFSDLVGSTELATSLSPDTADEVRREHFAAVRQAIAAHGGHEVKNLGDGVMVVFPLASQALAGAVAMQQAVHVYNVTAPRPLGLRVGLSAGEATREGEDYFGDPVIEASRLCARAEAGQILASDLVRANAGRRSTHGFTSLGELELKGLPERVLTLEVTWEPLEPEPIAPNGVPLPERLDRRPSVGVVGRDRELATLDDAIKRVMAGQGREVVLLAGEPGQGKTTLVAEVARRAHAHGAAVLLGRCDEEVGAPYLAFQEALSHYVAHADEALLRAHVAAHGGELSRLVPALGQRVGPVPAPRGSDADTERYQLFAAVVGLLEAAAAVAPLVVVLDDLHWADKPSLQLLRHVATHTSSTRLLVLGTYRDMELSASHPLTEALAALHREPAGMTGIDVKGLDDSGVLTFMESAAGHELDDDGVSVAHDVYRETDGNPFFVAELLRHLAESGAIYQDSSGRWRPAEADGAVALPHSVRAVIGARVSRLGENAVKLLATGSVIGREFDLDLLAETTGADEGDLVDLMDLAHRAAVVYEVQGCPGRYSFSHALVQHTLYEDMGPTRRTRVHRSVGEAMERLYVGRTDERAGELARHFVVASKPTDASKALAYTRRAGEMALAALAPDEAVSYFSQAVDLLAHVGPTDPAIRTDLLIGLGTAQRQSGDPGFRETLLEAARNAQQNGDTERLVNAALANSRGWFSSLGIVDVERVEILEAALKALPLTDGRSRARVLAQMCNELAFGPVERRIDLAREAKEIAHHIGDDTTLCAVLCDITNNPLRIPARLDESIENIREAVRLAEHLDDLTLQLLASALASTDCIRAADFDFATKCLVTHTNLAERLGQPTWLWSATFAGAGHALVHGDPTRAEELAEKALQIGTASGQPDAISFYGTQLVEIRHQQGRMGELAELIRQIAEEYPGIPTYRAALSRAKLEAGDSASASALVDEAAAHSFDLPMDVAWLDGIINYAQPVIELRMVGAADQLVKILRPFHGQVPFQGLVPHEPVAMFLGGLAAVLGRYQEADDYFEEADELNRRGEMRFAEAMTNLLWGRMLHTRSGTGDAGRARALLERAHESAAARGYAAVQRRAAEELAGLA